VGRSSTLTEAVAVLPVSPLVDDTTPVVLIKFPSALPVTPTITVQLLLSAILSLVSDMDPELQSAQRITGNPAAIVFAASLHTGCPQPLALTPAGKPAGVVIS